MTPTTAEWVSKAEDDFAVVCILRQSRKPGRLDAICFHAQQCAEKYLKARLTEAEVRFDKTHDLGALLKLLRNTEPLWLVMDAELKRLTDFAVASRYPGTSADKRASAEAYVTCRRLRTLARSSLGLPDK